MAMARGIGNAIVPQVGALFIIAYLLTDDLRRL
jgi:hypothetical protein